MDSLTLFSRPTRAWFEASFPRPTQAQAQGWEKVGSGAHTLIHAPTGSGKTLAAFLWTIDRLVNEPAPAKQERCRVLYVSPLKALAYDIERNLRAPLAGIRHAADRLGQRLSSDLTTFLRTGDTPPEDRRAMMRTPPDILITTPESLFLLLTSEARKTLCSVRWVILDEVHAIAGTKRGAHLALSLERLENLTSVSPQRIGLSATQRPLETIGRFLGGFDNQGKSRPVAIVDAPSPRPLELELVVPVEDMAEPAPPDPLDPDATKIRSIWPAVYPRLVDLIEQHSSTIVFANSRRLAERICAEINTHAGTELARAHHGSVAREQRVQIEESLKRGELKAVVATSSLELGIDMGSVDLVVQVEAPISVSSGLQRVGRAGHQVGGVSRAKVFPKYRGDLVVAAVIGEEMAEGRIEETHLPRNPLDVLSQQLVAMAAMDEIDADQLFATVRRAAPYADLTSSVFEATLDMLAGRYPSDLFAELRPRLVWDRLEGMVSGRPGARQLAIANAGTIPDRGLFRVALPDGSKVGELDEELVYESRVGDVFILGASTWRISAITAEKVEVIPAPGEPAAKIPFWKGDAPGRPLQTGQQIGRFLRLVRDTPPDEMHKLLTDRYHLDELAANNLINYVEEQSEATGSLPTDQTLVVERFRDEIGDWRVVILSPLGAKVHAPWALAVIHKLRSRAGTDVDVVWTDDGIAFRFPDADQIPSAADLIPEPEELEVLLIDHLPDTALFAARFREAAGRALLLPKRRPGSRTPLWQRRRKAADLLATARQFAEFPIILETYREILQDDFDLAALTGVMSDIRSRRIHVVEVETPGASPFATSLLFSFVAAFLYEGDAPLAERRAAALTVDRRLLGELLGEGELRELISPEVMAVVELELQHLTHDKRLRGAHGVHDLLRTLGPLTEADIEVRTIATDVPSVLAELEANRRAIPVFVAGSQKWAAIEDAGRLRDALGVQPPTGVPFTFLEPVADPLGDVIARYARTHGPFTASQAALALGLPSGVVEAVLAALAAKGRVTPGAFRPGGEGQEWVEVGVLQRLKRRSLSVLRHEIEPVEAAALGRFLPAWQKVSERPRRGPAALTETVRRLQGVAVPASALERDILACRVDEPGPLLDRLLLDGELVWLGRGPLGAKDGRVALYLRDQLSRLWTPPDHDRPEGELHESVRLHLAQRGASFFREIYQAAGGGDPLPLLDALWDLVWHGEITNDTFDPVRAFLSGGVRKAGARRPHLPSTFPPRAAGRWSLVADLLEGLSPTAAGVAWAEQLLDRHGVVTRSTVLAEGLPGGFSGIYPVFAHLEETGRVRRGYFVEGLGGAQFALPGAVDRLRTSPERAVVALAATDPANPYGAALPWPDNAGGRLARAAGAYVLVADGNLVAYLDRGGKRMTMLQRDPELAGEIARELAGIASRHRRFVLETVDEQPAVQSPIGPALSEWGFTTALRGLAYRG